MQEKRVKEREIIKPALKIIRDNPGISTSELIKKLQKIAELYPGDKEILPRRNDTKFSQIVRNLISHKNYNKFGKCIYEREQGRNTGFYINELGENEIQGYEKSEIKEEKLDNEFQRKVRESNDYNEIEELMKADSRIPEKMSRSNNSRYKVDPRITKTVLKKNNYICEIEKLTGEEHKTFVTNKDVQYMEGHHLIPMKAQKDFKINIDRSDNICCLCPNCHRAIHYGTIKEKRARLSLLYNSKIRGLNENKICIDFEELINNYYI